MTATLSPTKISEAVRFGIHDVDVIAGMEERAADVAECEAEGCSEGITKLTGLRCCRAAWRTCDLHFAEGKAQAVAFLATCVVRGSKPHCLGCQHIFPFGSRFDEVYRVVDL